MSSPEPSQHPQTTPSPSLNQSHRITCPKCRHHLRSEQAIPPGKKAVCPHCQTHFLTPAGMPASQRSASVLGIPRWAWVGIGIGGVAALLLIGGLIAIIRWTGEPAEPLVEREEQGAAAGANRSLDHAPGAAGREPGTTAHASSTR